MISSSWYAALDTNGEETISQVLTSFRNQLSRFLSHQYHLGGMRLWSLILDIRYSENYSSGSTHPHPTYSDLDHKYTHFSYANICFRTYDHTSFLAPVFLYPLCITNWNLILLDTIFRSRIQTYHLGDIPIMCRYFWAPWSCSPYFGSAFYMSCMFCVRLVLDPKVFVTNYLAAG